MENDADNVATEAKDHVDRARDQWAEAAPSLDTSSMDIMARLYRYQFFVDKELGQLYRQHGVSFGEFDVLATLRRNQVPLTPTELMASSMLTSGAMTNRLDKLEKAKLIQRQHSHEDRRSIRVSLTAEGRLLIDELAPLHMARQQRLLEGLSDLEKEQLAALLKKALLVL